MKQVAQNKIERIVPLYDISFILQLTDGSVIKTATNRSLLFDNINGLITYQPKIETQTPEIGQSNIAQ